MAALIQQIGSYAGLAAILGLGVMSLLYIAQARELRRLRGGSDWDVEPSEPQKQADHDGGDEPPAEPPAPESQPDQARPADDQSTQAAPASDTTAQRVEAPQPGSQVPVAASDDQPTQAAPASGTTAQPAKPPQSGSQMPALSVGLRRSLRHPGVFIALRVGGVLVFACVVALAVVALATQGGSQRRVSAAPVGRPPVNVVRPVDPASVTVAVLNASPISGLAGRVGQQARQQGFRVERIANAAVRNQSQSMVLYTPAGQAAAPTVAQRLQIPNVAPADVSITQSGAGAQVIIMLGSDKQGPGV